MSVETQKLYLPRGADMWYRACVAGLADRAGERIQACHTCLVVIHGELIVIAEARSLTKWNCIFAASHYVGAGIGSGRCWAVIVGVEASAEMLLCACFLL